MNMADKVPALRELIFCGGERQISKKTAESECYEENKAIEWEIKRGGGAFWAVGTLKASLMR